MRLPLLCGLNFAVLAGGMTTTASDLSRPLSNPQLEQPTLHRWASTGSSRARTTRTPSSGWSTARRARRPGERPLVPTTTTGRHVVPRLGMRSGNRSRFLPGPGSRPEGRSSRRPCSWWEPGSTRKPGRSTVAARPGQLVARLRLTIGMLRATTPISSPFPRWMRARYIDLDLQWPRICGQNHRVGNQYHVLPHCSNQKMKR